MRSKPIQYSDAVQKLLENSALDSLDISYFLNSGEVDFGRSDTQSTPCKTYYIEGVVKEIPQVLKVKNCPDSIEIVDLEP